MRGEGPLRVLQRANPCPPAGPVTRAGGTANCRWAALAERVSYASATGAPILKKASVTMSTVTFRNLTFGSLQFKNRRSLTLFTRPSIRKTDQVLEPPKLISGSGMPVTGMRPTTIPTFTST